MTNALRSLTTLLVLTFALIISFSFFAADASAQTSDRIISFSNGGPIMGNARTTLDFVVFGWDSCQITRQPQNTNLGESFSGNIGSGNRYSDSNLTASQTYRLTCTKGELSGYRDTTVVRNSATTSPRMLTLTKAPEAGGATRITWTTSDAKHCWATDGGVGWEGVKDAAGGSVVVKPTSTTTYSMVCWNGDTGAGNQASVIVSGVSQSTQTSSPTLALTTAQEAGGATRITWTTSGVTDCVATRGDAGWAGTKAATGGSVVVKPTLATTYAMVCWNSATGLTTGTKSVIVLSATSVSTNTTSTSSAATLALINQLMQQIAALQAQLSALQGQNPTPIAILTQDLSLGSRGPEVSALQSILALLGYLDRENISGYFGPITEAAVKRFQCDRNIVCTGTFSTTGYGGVGPLTRAALNAAAISSGGVTPTNPTTPTTTPTTTTPITPTCPTGTSWNGSRCVSTSTGPSPTGLSCYRDNLYENGTLKQTCPQAPNGGIACDVSLGGCAGEGYVWINGQRVRWEGNTSGYCYADSACEANHECNKNTDRCTPKTIETTEDGARYKQTWDESKQAWGPKVFVACVSGYHETSPGSKKCESNTRSCSISGGTGEQTYNTTTKTWSSCTLTGCPTGQHVENSKCVSNTRACEFKPTLTNGYGVQTWNGSWGECERKCNNDYYLKSVTTSSSDYSYWWRVVGTTSWGTEYTTNTLRTCEYLPRTMSFTATNKWNGSMWQLEVVAQSAVNLKTCQFKVQTNDGVTKDLGTATMTSGQKKWTLSYADMKLATVGGVATATCYSESWYGLLPKEFTATYSKGN